jgi:hypothetical protein
MKTYDSKPNVNLPSQLRCQTLVIQVLYPLLRHLNTGTLSVVLMIALALVNAVRGTESASKGPVVDNAIITGMTPDRPRVWLETSRLADGREITCFRQPAQSRICVMHQRRSKSTGENN